MEAKRWFVQWSKHMQNKHRWSFSHCWRNAQQMLPQLLSKVHEDSPRRWHQEKGVGTPGAPHKNPGPSACEADVIPLHHVLT
eukprot:6455333-Amphidinium_carterae.1